MKLIELSKSKEGETTERRPHRILHLVLQQVFGMRREF